MYNNTVVIAVLLLCSAVTLGVKQHCLLGDFESQVKYLQRNLMLSPDDVMDKSRVFDDVRDTLQRRWEDAEVIPYGSLTTGVSLTISDADCFVKIPNINPETDQYVVEEVMELFEQQPDLYSQLMLSPAKTNKDLALLTLYHHPTDMYCDLLFDSMLGLQSSRLFGYFIKLDERLPPLAGIIKLWSRIHQLTGPRNLTNFGLYSLIIFYLQQKNVGPPVFKLQNNSQKNIFDEWDMYFNEIPYRSTNTENLHQLLGGFFKYYSEFNFKDYIVSPFAGRPIHRSEFRDTTNVPDEFSLYKLYMSKKDAVPLGLEADICIQEAFEHNKNAAERIELEHTLKLLSHFKFAARMFKELSSDRFLRSILIKDQHNETFERKKNITVDQISKFEDCINETIA